MIYENELVNDNLHPMMQAQLLMAANMAELGSTVTVCLTAPKVTDGKPRIAGKDYMGLPGVAPGTQIGPLEVHRYVDNPGNRKLDRVNGVYFKVRSVTRANGKQPFGWTAVRPHDITGFMILGVETGDSQDAELATRSLAEAASQAAQ
jgi:hypothetical protein